MFIKDEGEVEKRTNKTKNVKEQRVVLFETVSSTRSIKFQVMYMLVKCANAAMTV